MKKPIKRLREDVVKAAMRWHSIKELPDDMKKIPAWERVTQGRVDRLDKACSALAAREKK